MLPADAKDYDSLCKSFVMPAPTHYNMGADITDKHAALGRWDDPAVFFEDEDGMCLFCFGA